MNRYDLIIRNGEVYDGSGGPAYRVATSELKQLGDALSGDRGVALYFNSDWEDADGILATLVSGEVIYRDGEATGALPGQLVRGHRTDPRQAAEAAA
jgi:N-acyl-D-aspartate/D-glutamate deacylase